MSVLNLLASDSFLTINKDLVKKTDLHCAIIMGHFASVQNYFDSDWFFQTYEKIEEATTLTKYQASKAIKRLENLGILEHKKEGIPCRKYYHIIEKNLISFLEVKTFATSSKKTLRQGGKKFDNINKNKNNNNKGNKNKKEKINKKQKKLKLSAEEVYKLYGIYPRKKGKAKGLEYLQRHKFDTEEEKNSFYNRTLRAIRKFKKEAERQNNDKEFLPYFSTFVNNKDGLMWDYIKSPEEIKAEEEREREKARIEMERIEREEAAARHNQFVEETGKEARKIFQSIGGKKQEDNIELPF